MVIAVRGSPLSLARLTLKRAGYLDTYHLRPRLDLDALLHSFGIVWHRRDLAGLAGAMVQLDDRCYVVTDRRQNWARQRFSAAHELKHYLTDRHLSPVFYCSRVADRGIERAANVFARELLMPAEVVRWLYTEREFYSPEEIGKVLGVSAEAAGYRIAELGLGRERVVWWE